MLQTTIVELGQGLLAGCVIVDGGNVSLESLENETDDSAFFDNMGKYFRADTVIAEEPVRL